MTPTVDAGNKVTLTYDYITLSLRLPEARAIKQGICPYQDTKKGDVLSAAHKVIHI